MYLRYFSSGVSISDNKTLSIQLKVHFIHSKLYGKFKCHFMKSDLHYFGFHFNTFMFKCKVYIMLFEVYN